MPIHFIDNYPKNNLESIIIKQDGSPLHGEIWVYRQFIQFNDNNLLPDDTWYLKHNFNLFQHPASKRKIKGQIDFLLLLKSGIASVSTQILHNEYAKVLLTKSIIQECKTVPDNLQFINDIIKDSRFTPSEKIILVHSNLLEDFNKLTVNIFKKNRGANRTEYKYLIGQN